MDGQTLTLIPLLFIAALLFSSVGHGGATAYLAAMALVAVTPETMRPAALILNIFVASIALYKFYQVRAFSIQLFLPLALSAVPFAFVGGLLTLPGHFYKPVIGITLVFAGWHIFSGAKKIGIEQIKQVSTVTLILIGSALGFLSGLTGIGGGVFLSPILLGFKWAETKVVSGVAAGFILVNSMSGLIGVMTKSPTLPTHLPYWVAAVILGGLLGSVYGSRKLANPTIRKILAVILVFAGLKMLVNG